MALFEGFCAFFWPPFPEALFSWLWSAVLWQRIRWGGHARNATKQGVSEPFRVSVPLRSLVAFRKGSFLWTCLEDNFFRVTILYGSMFEILSKLGFKGQKPPGAAEPSSFWKGYFSQFVRCARKFGARGVRGGAVFFSWILGPCQKWPCRCGAEGFSVFSGFFLTPFSKTSSGPLHIPLFFFGCFSLLFAFFLGLGATPHCTYVFGQLAFNPSYLLGVFGVFLEKHCFSPWRRVIWVHFSVSPFCVSLSFVLASFTSLCHSLSFSLSLSLSLSLSFFFLFFLPCCLVFIFTFLVFCCFFLSCCFVFVSWEEQLQNITFENLLFIIYLFIFLFRLSNMFLSLFFII